MHEIDQKKRALFRKIGEPFRRLREAIQEFSDNPEDLNITDKLTEFAGEVLSLAAIWYVAWKGAKDPVISYKVTSEESLSNLAEFQKMAETLANFGDDFFGTEAEINELEHVWKEQFQEKINDTPYWDELPSLTAIGLTNREILLWSRYLGDLTKKMKQSEGSASDTFDLSAGKDSLKYQITEIDPSGQIQINTVLYGLVGTAFVFYEEVFGVNFLNVVCN